jgi:uncharacterized cupin superfamily protein
MKFELAKHPVHLGLGATAVMLPEFEGTMEWYQRYGEAYEDDGSEGRLVAIHSFTEDWPTWEVHPLGAELVYVISGKMTLVQSDEGERTEIVLEAGEAAINPPGVWHTAKISEPTAALFVTAGLGTRNEPEPPEGG